MQRSVEAFHFPLCLRMPDAAPVQPNPFRISHKDRCVRPEADFVLHHGVP